MKKLLTTLLLGFIFSSTANAQLNLSKRLKEKELITYWKSDSLFNAGEYESALKYYKKCKPKHTFEVGWPVKKSLCLLLTGDTTSAIKHFQKHVKKGGHYTYTASISQIPLYTDIAPNKDVQNQFFKNTTDFENSDSTCLYPNVLKTLMEIRKSDQGIRNGEIDSDLTMSVVDSLNQIKLDSLIEIYGWLGYKQVGKSGENITFLVAQHADRNPVFQKKCIKLMEKELFTGNISPSFFAMIYDRIKVNSDQPQLFGSQVRPNLETGILTPLEIENPQLVNAYRLYFGLPSLESYIELMNNRNN